MLVGIGSIAWLFDLRKSAPSFSSLSDETTALYGNDRATISAEELNTGVAVHSNEANQGTVITAAAASIPKHPGAYPDPSPEELRRHVLAEALNATEKHKDVDPTLLFTTLLIAKPLPFKFDLRVRNQDRAERVRLEFEAKKEAGEFVDSKYYWGPEEGKGQELGWGKV